MTIPLALARAGVREPDHLNVVESFGPTIQGEGRAAGRLVSFLRLAGCNLSCSWCDTPYSWDWSRYDRAAEVTRMDLDAAVALVLTLTERTPVVVVSGGEPLNQARGLGALMAHPALAGVEWHVETNGTRPLGPTAGRWALVTASPKIIPSADQGPRAHRLADDVLEVADLKFVVRDDADAIAVRDFIRARGIDPGRVWLMPEGTTPEALTARSGFVADVAIALGTNFSSRLHVYAWHDVRGH